ncbi:unnamed protein product, partial [Symbiodinium pilosum]
IVQLAEGLLRFSQPDHRSVLTARLSAGMVNGEHVQVVVQATRQADGSPSDEVRVSLINANGEEIGSQRSSMRMLGNSDEILKDFSEEVPREESL